MISRTARRPASVSGSSGLGTALSGTERICSIDTPSLRSSPETSAVCISTPIEPVTVPSRATIRSAPSATM